MADNDLELDIGVKLDETGFLPQYQSFLSSLKTETQKAIMDAVDHVKGPVAKNWGTFPYESFHTNSGAANASKAFLPGFASDLKDLGISKNSVFYEAALMSAAYRSSVPDPFHRANLLQSYGQNAPAPDSNIERVLNTDYELLSMPWSRAFIKQGKKGTKANFAKMREYAVEQGLGRWIDPDEKHTADNFELINNELEDIAENSGKSEKVFRDWNDTLKGVLGTLTAIGGLTAIGNTLKSVYAKSEKGTEDAGATLNRRRAFVGMSAIDELSAQVAGQAVGLGKNAITNEIMTLSSNREKYKLLGQGLDALYPSLTGIFDNIMTIEDPMEMYKSILTEVYGAMKGADNTTRARTLMLLESQGLGGVADIVGSMISNEAFAKKLGYDPTKLFSLENNPYYNVYQGAETLLPDITKLNQSLNASYSEIYRVFEESFGLPFKDWWDDVMKDKVVPWFQKFADIFGKEKLTPAEEVATDTALDVGMAIINTEKGQAKATEAQSGAIKLAVNNWEFTKRTLPFASLNNMASLDYSQSSGKAVRAGWDTIDNILDYKPKDIRKAYEQNKTLTDEQREASIKDALDIQSRIQYMKNRLKDARLLDFLTNKKTEDMDKLLMLSIQQGLYGGSNWQEQFDSFIEAALNKGSTGTEEAILEALNKIAGNTEAANALLAKRDFWAMVENAVGVEKANEIRSKVANRAY